MIEKWQNKQINNKQLNSRGVSPQIFQITSYFFRTE